MLSWIPYSYQLYFQLIRRLPKHFLSFPTHQTLLGVFIIAVIPSGITIMDKTDELLVTDNGGTQYARWFLRTKRDTSSTSNWQHINTFCIMCSLFIKLKRVNRQLNIWNSLLGDMFTPHKILSLYVLMMELGGGAFIFMELARLFCQSSSSTSHSAPNTV